MSGDAVIPDCELCWPQQPFAKYACESRDSDAEASVASEASASFVPRPDVLCRGCGRDFTGCPSVQLRRIVFNDQRLDKATEMSVFR
jgi:hypothetical protein